MSAYIFFAILIPAYMVIGVFSLLLIEVDDIK